MEVIFHFLILLAMCQGIATVLIKRVTGPGGGPTMDDVTATDSQLNAFDAPFDGIAHPVRVPPSGLNYSFWGSFCLVCSAAPDVVINNIAWYTDGSDDLGVGVGLNVSTVAGTNGDITTNYTEATGTPGDTGDEMGANYGHGITTPVDAFTQVSASPLSVPGSFTTGVDTPSNSPTGRFGDWVIYQLTVDTSATAHVTDTEPITWVWDEV